MASAIPFRGAETILRLASQLRACSHSSDALESTQVTIRHLFQYEISGVRARGLVLGCACGTLLPCCDTRRRDDGTSNFAARNARLTAGCVQQRRPAGSGNTNDTQPCRWAGDRGTHHGSFCVLLLTSASARWHSTLSNTTPYSMAVLIAFIRLSRRNFHPLQRPSGS